MEKAQSPSQVRRLTAIIVPLVLSVYSFPYFATTAVLRSKQVPFSFAADLSLYLNLSQIGSSHVNPYFGSTIPSGELGYATFDLAFRLFGLLVKMVGNDLWWAVLIWNLLWWSTLCFAAIWFFLEAFPEEGTLISWFGLTLLFFFNFGIVKSLVAAWLHLPFLTGFDRLNLPVIRTFFPQIPVALVVLYLVLQIRALRSQRLSDWAGMCFLQAFAFAIFPYGTPIMAGTTVVAALANYAIEKRLKRLRGLMTYGAVCGMIDVAFLLLRLSGGRQHPNLTLISFQPSRAIGLVGGGLLLLMLLTVATAFLPSAGTRETKWTIVGLGIAVSLLMLGDTIFSPMFLVSHHGAYFQHMTISLQIVYLFAGAFARFGRHLSWLRLACLASIGFVGANGVILAYVDYRYSLPQNSRSDLLAFALRSLDLTKDDMVIARAETVDDDCSWVPIFSPTTVLFCRPAQYAMSAKEKRTLYRSRQAFYLYFKGEDSGQVARIAGEAKGLPDRDLAEQTRLAFSGEVNPADEQRWDEARTSIQRDLIPALAQVEQGNMQVRIPSCPRGRILVVEDARSPVFVAQRLSRYLSVDSQTRIGDFRFLWCKPI